MWHVFPDQLCLPPVVNYHIEHIPRLASSQDELLDSPGVRLALQVLLEAHTSLERDDRLIDGH